MKLTLEFAGGMELLFGNQRELEIDIPGEASDVTTALQYIKTHVLVDTDRVEMFMKGQTIRPGVLVLINDADWELTGMEESGTCDDGFRGMVGRRPIDGVELLLTVFGAHRVPRQRTTYAELEDGDKLAFISTLHGG
jgi:ubiquitin related modifier 1